MGIVVVSLFKFQIQILKIVNLAEKKCVLWKIWLSRSCSEIVRCQSQDEFQEGQSE